jgi:DUF917 family protein
VTQTLYGIAVTPLALADEHGNLVVVDAVDNFWTERLARSAVIEYGAIAPGVGFPLTKPQMQLASVHGSVSMALEIGQALARADRGEGDPLEAVLAATRGVELFAGKVNLVDRNVTGGWAVGEVIVEGADKFAGQTMRITFQNENLMAYIDGVVAACVPDLITVVEQDSCRAITTERLRFGARVRILAMPCDDKWLTPAGIELAGPAHFGYDDPYTPYAGRVDGRVTTGSGV